MANIKLTINDAAASASVDGLLTAGAVGIPVEVSISGERWLGIAPRLYARNGSTDIEMVIDADGNTTVPHECMIARGVLQLGVVGTAADGSIRIPTIWASCGVVRASADDAEPGQHVEPTPDIVDQITEMAYNADGKANAAQAATTAAQKAAELAEKIAEETGKEIETLRKEMNEALTIRCSLDENERFCIVTSVKEMIVDA